MYTGFPLKIRTNLSNVKMNSPFRKLNRICSENKKCHFTQQMSFNNVAVVEAIFYYFSKGRWSPWRTAGMSAGFYNIHHAITMYYQIIMRPHSCVPHVEKGWAISSGRSQLGIICLCCMWSPLSSPFLSYLHQSYLRKGQQYPLSSHQYDCFTELSVCCLLLFLVQWTVELQPCILNRRTSSSSWTAT